MRIWKHVFSTCKLLQGFAESTGGILIIAIGSQHTASWQKIEVRPCLFLLLEGNLRSQGLAKIAGLNQGAQS